VTLLPRMMDSPSALQTTYSPRRQSQSSPICWPCTQGPSGAQHWCTCPAPCTVGGPASTHLPGKCAHRPAGRRASALAGLARPSRWRSQARRRPRRHRLPLGAPWLSPWHKPNCKQPRTQAAPSQCCVPEHSGHQLIAGCDECVASWHLGTPFTALILWVRSSPLLDLWHYQIRRLAA